MQFARALPILRTGRFMQGDDEFRNDRCETDLGAGTADHVAGKQVLIAGAEHSDIWTPRRDVPPILLIGRNFPTAFFNCLNTWMRNQALDIGEFVGHTPRTHRRLIEYNW